MSSFLADWQVLVSFIVNYLFHSTLLLAGCWALLAATRIDSQYLAERLWKLAAVLGIFTAAFQVWLPPLMPGQQSDGQVAVVDDDRSVIYARAEVVSADSLVVTPSVTRRPALTAPNASNMHSRESIPSSTWLPKLLQFVVVLACGFVALSVVIGTLLALWHSFRLRWHFSDARKMQSGAASETLSRLLQRTRVRRRVQLLESPKQNEPIAYGLFCWTIVLPLQVEERLEPAELDGLMAHEVAHLVRGDVWWLWLGRALCTCFAIQPLNLLARRRWQQAAEYLCDEWAVESGVESLSLARCLTKIAEWRLDARSTTFGLAAGGSKSTLMQRVERLVDATGRPDRWRKPLRRRMVNVIAIACVVLISGFAPKVTFPESTSSEGLRTAMPVPLPASSVAWREAEEELTQLQSDLDRALQLLESNSSRPGVAELIRSLRDRMENLQTQRTRVRSFIERNQDESQFNFSIGFNR